MRDLKQIELATIKNLEMIYFYDINHAPYIGLNIVYDNGKNLNYNYNYELFNSYLSRVIELYKKEDKTKIQFLNEESKNLMEKLIVDDSIIKQDIKYEKKDPKYLSRKIEVSFTMEYIKRALSLFLSTMYDEDITIYDVKGYRDRYLAYYNQDDEQKTISFIIIKQDNNHYVLKFNFVNDSIMSFEGNINIYKDCITLKYESDNYDLNGANIYSVDDKVLETIKHMGLIVNYEEPNYEIDNELIDSYLNLLNLPILKNRIKTVNNNYLIVDKSDDNTDYLIHISLDEKFANVKVEKRVGYFKDNIYIQLDKEQIDINMYLEDDLVVEKNYINKGFLYEYYQIKSNDLTQKIEIKEKIKRK